MGYRTQVTQASRRRRLRHHRPPRPAGAGAAHHQGPVQAHAGQRRRSRRSVAHRHACARQSRARPLRHPGLILERRCAPWPHPTGPTTCQRHRTCSSSSSSTTRQFESGVEAPPATSLGVCGRPRTRGQLDPCLDKPASRQGPRDTTPPTPAMHRPEPVSAPIPAIVLTLIAVARDGRLVACVWAGTDHAARDAGPDARRRLARVLDRRGRSERSLGARWVLVGKRRDP